MEVRVVTIVEWTDEAGTRLRHDIPDGSGLRNPAVSAGFVGRVTGPGHLPYWLRSDGSTSKKGPA